MNNPKVKLRKQSIFFSKLGIQYSLQTGVSYSLKKSLALAQTLPESKTISISHKFWHTTGIYFINIMLTYFSYLKKLQA